MTEHNEGWAFPGAARKAHYFRDSRSLCRKWLYTGPVEPPGKGPERSPDDCVPCRRLLDLAATAAGESTIRGNDAED